MKKTAKKKPVKNNKPTAKDGHHFRWFLHPCGHWTIAHVGPWDHRSCTFDIMGFEGFLVSATKEHHWGPVVEDYGDTKPSFEKMALSPLSEKWWLKRRGD